MIAEAKLSGTNYDKATDEVVFVVELKMKNISMQGDFRMPRPLLEKLYKRASNAKKDNAK